MIDGDLLFGEQVDGRAVAAAAGPPAAVVYAAPRMQVWLWPGGPNEDAEAAVHSSGHAPPFLESDDVLRSIQDVRGSCLLRLGCVCLSLPGCYCPCCYCLCQAATISAKLLLSLPLLSLPGCCSLYQAATVSAKLLLTLPSCHSCKSLGSPL